MEGGIFTLCSSFAHPFAFRPRLPEDTICSLVDDETLLRFGNVEIIRCDESLTQVCIFLYIECK